MQTTSPRRLACWNLWGGSPRAFSFLAKEKPSKARLLLTCTLHSTQKTTLGVGAGTLVDLKAQYYLGQEQARHEKESGQSSKGRKRKKDEDGFGGTSNKGVLERDKKDRLHLKSKEDIEQESYAQLQKKAELYDQLGKSRHITSRSPVEIFTPVAQGEGDEDTTELYEVDFLEKRYEEHQKKPSVAPEAPEADEEERKRRREVRDILITPS